MTPRSGYATGKVERREAGTCATCGWWRQARLAEYGACLRLLDKERATEDHPPAYISTLFSGTLATRPDFGCTEWSEKE